MNSAKISEADLATNGLACENDNRSEPRFETPGKSVSILTFVEVPMKNRSPSGFCLRIPRRVHIEVNQKIIVYVDGGQRTAIVRWVRAVDPIGNEMTAGCELIDADPFALPEASDDGTEAPE